MGNESGTESGTYEIVKKWLENQDMRQTIQKALPKGMPLDSWISAVLTAMRMDDQIKKASPLSVMGAILTFASLGLRLEGPLGQAYFSVKGKGKKNNQGYYDEHEAQAGIGYMGLLAIAYRDPKVEEIEAHVVYEKDRFDFRLGSDRHLHHSWDVRQRDRGPMIAAYCGIRYKNGLFSFKEPYPIEDIMTVRDMALRQKYIYVEYDADGREIFYKLGPKPKNRGQSRERIALKDWELQYIPWLAHLKPMVMKTAVRWDSKYWDLSAEFSQAANLIGMEDAGVSQGLENYAAVRMPEGITSDGSVKPSAAVRGLDMRRGSNLVNQMAEEATKRSPETAPAGGKGPPSNNGTDTQNGQQRPDMGQDEAVELTEEEKAEIEAAEREEYERHQNTESRGE